jgi:hypothetical protein
VSALALAKRLQRMIAPTKSDSSGFSFVTHRQFAVRIGVRAVPPSLLAFLTIGLKEIITYIKITIPKLKFA